MKLELGYLEEAQNSRSSVGDLKIKTSRSEKLVLQFNVETELSRNG